MQMEFLDPEMKIN